MHNRQDIEENRCFRNGGTILHFHAIAQGRPEDSQVEFLQGPHGIVNPPKNIVLNNIRRFTQMTNGLLDYEWGKLHSTVTPGKWKDTTFATGARKKYSGPYCCCRGRLPILTPLSGYPNKTNSFTGKIISKLGLRVYCIRLQSCQT